MVNENDPQLGGKGQDNSPGLPREWAKVGRSYKIGIKTTYSLDRVLIERVRWNGYRIVNEIIEEQPMNNEEQQDFMFDGRFAQRLYVKWIIANEL